MRFLLRRNDKRTLRASNLSNSTFVIPRHEESHNECRYGEQLMRFLLRRNDKRESRAINVISPSGRNDKANDMKRIIKNSIG